MAPAVLGLGSLLAAAAPARAQVTAPVPLESRTYERVEQLLSAGLVETALAGQRPYSRLEVARIAREARVRLLERQSAGNPRHERISRILTALEREYAPELAVLGQPGAAATSRALDGAAASAMLLDSPGRPIEDVGLGGIDARVNPLVEHRGGRQYGDRATFAGEMAAHVQAGRHLALDGQVRITGSEEAADARVRALAASVGARNIVLRVGRQPLLLGQGISGGLFASRNAPALDMIALGNDIPARLPWVLDRLGLARGTVFVADLGGDQFFPHTKLVGWKVSFLPSSRFEVGMSLLSQQGGEGAPGARWHERVLDVVTIVDVLFLQDRDLVFSNKLAGFDLRWRLPPVELYFDGMADDFDVRRLGSSLWEDAGYVAGVVLPELGRSGAGRLEAEFQHTGLRYYQHGQFQSGVTVDGTIIGLPLGPRGDALLARFRWDPAAAWTLAVTGALEQRSGDHYTTQFGENDSGWTFLKTADRPEERRGRLLVEWTRLLAGGDARLELEGGVEQVGNHDFVAGASRMNGLARVALVYGFR